MKRYLILGFFISLNLIGCSQSTMPQEMNLAEKIDYDLWKAGAYTYAPEEYTAFQATLRNTKNALIAEEARLSWFRDYTPINIGLKTIIKDGNEILKVAQERKIAKRADITSQLTQMEERIKNLDRLTHTINEGRLARRSLTRGELMVKEASLALEREDYDIADERLTSASGYIRTSEDILVPFFNRYTNKSLIERWKRWAEDTVAESRDKGGSAIVVRKIDRSLTIYRYGKPFKTYEIGLGRNGSRDKLHAGDGATPEGKYRIIKKLDKSSYYKALLINYPNSEDRKRFLTAKRKGVISRNASIGGLIEIHGGGKDGMTYGCINLEDRDIDEIFDTIPLGTPVAIVGTTHLKNDILFVPKKVEG